MRRSTEGGENLFSENSSALGHLATHDLDQPVRGVLLPGGQRHGVERRLGSRRRSCSTRREQVVGVQRVQRRSTSVVHRLATLLVGHRQHLGGRRHLHPTRRATSSCTRCPCPIFTARPYAEHGICRRRVSVCLCVCVCVCVLHFGIVSKRLL